MHRYGIPNSCCYPVSTTQAFRWASALSRAAQRWGVRTVEHLVKATKLSAAFIADLVDNEQTLDALDGRTFADRVVQVGKDARLNCVITQHDKRPAVVIATVY
jgi:hypothetical protein